MPYLILPSRRTRQPQGNARANSANRLTAGIVNLSTPSIPFDVVNGASLVLGRTGVAESGASMFADASIDSRAPYALQDFIAHSLAFSWRGTATGTYWVTLKAGANGGVLSQYGGDNLGWTIAGATFDAWVDILPQAGCGVDWAHDNKRHVIVLTWNGAGDGLGRAYVDGVLRLTGGTAYTGIMGRVSNFRSNAYVSLLDSYAGDGSLDLFAAWNRQLSAGEVAELSSNRWQLFASSPRRIYFDAGAGGGAVTLVHDDSTQAQSADNTLLTTQSFLIVGDATQSHTSENVVLDASVSTNLVVQESTQAHTSENAVLTASSNLVLQDATQAQASDNVILTSAHSIIIQECTHNHTSENINLDSGLILTVADALSTQQVDNLELLAACLLSIDDSNHTQLTDSIDLSTLHSLNIAETTHAITSESPTLTIPGSGTGATAEEIAAAVLAALEATTIPVDIKKVNSVSITGIGTDPNPWRAV